ncbi:helicase RepA family protein [Paraburkholderia megapolitana]|uniref:helicase RepA family protein n=1 Tax=Paraburkholderia megapolitana TaxID=420953 RepID=UPI0038B6F828
MSVTFQEKPVHPGGEMFADAVKTSTANAPYSTYIFERGYFHQESWAIVGTPDTIAAFQWCEDNLPNDQRDALIDLAVAHDMLQKPFYEWLKFHGFSAAEASSRRVSYSPYGSGDFTGTGQPERQTPSPDLLWSLAVGCGWSWVSTWVSDAEAEEQAAQAEVEQATQVEAAKAVKLATMRLRLRPADELMNAPPMRWHVRDVLPATGLVALYGPPGSGKSFLLLDLCATLARGDGHWFGHFIRQSIPVVYAVLEGQGGFGQRLKAWSAVHGGSPPPDRLRFLTDPFNLRDEHDVDDLCKAALLMGGQGGLIVLDTLSRAAPGTDENSGEDMGEVIAACAEIQRKMSGTVLLVHHTGKDAARGLRGHSSLAGAVDVAIETSRNGDFREWTIAKSRDAADGLRETFRLKLVDLGVDDYSQPVTSYVVQVEDNSEMTVKLPASLQQLKPVFDKLSPEGQAVSFGEFCKAVRAWFIKQGNPTGYRRDNIGRDYAKHFKVSRPGGNTLIVL